MLTFGYNGGLPPGVTTAWGCRVCIDQSGTVHMVWDRVDLVGPDQTRLAAHLVSEADQVWRQRASELLHHGEMLTSRAQEFLLYEDSAVVVKGNTMGSHGYLYVCAYLRQRCQHPGPRGSGFAICDQPLDDAGQCPNANAHREVDT